jgi:hypothetical protein
MSTGAEGYFKQRAEGSPEYREALDEARKGVNEDYEPPQWYCPFHPEAHVIDGSSETEDVETGGGWADMQCGHRIAVIRMAPAHDDPEAS